MFRRGAFRAFCGRKSSEGKFIHRIKDAFSTCPTRSMAILSGNWGRNPNLKHSPPTPGIGLRRRIHAHIQTITTPEHHTSDTCFDCEHRDRHMEQHKYDAHGNHLREVLRLLRCTNATCSRWWNRDVMGALNIGKQSVHLLRHGTTHPCFNHHTD